MMALLHRILTNGAVALSISALFVSCGNGSSPSVADADVLVKVGSASLSRSELMKNMPGGLTEDDSVKYARAYIRSWIDTKLVSQIAAREIDMSEIDKMVEQYRNELIMWEYNSRMFEAHGQTDIPEDSIKSYYEANRNEFILDRPLVKGLYLKVPDDAKQLPAMRKLYRSTRPDDIDRLEKSELNGAVHYDFFRDHWIDWEQIESLIPMDFGTSADAFLNANRYIDTSQGGFTYLLDINDVLHSGQIMPYEAAKPLIIDRLTFQNRRSYESTLRKNLYEKSLSDGKIKLNCEL